MIAVFDVAVIGGGASGHAAAIMAARTGNRDLRVVILERASRVGRKLLATGNGRCNLTNLHADVTYYHGADPAFVRPALNRHSPEWTMSFFDDIGIPCLAEEDGRVYPYGSQAAAVQDALRNEAARLGVETLCDFDVDRLLKREALLLEDTPLFDAWPFDIHASDGRLIRTGAVIIAAGGEAAPQLGGTGAGYRLLSQLGHPCTRTLPAIVQVTTEKEFVKSLSGIRLEGNATLWQDGRAIRSETGEILFTDYGLSGPAILQLGGFVSRGLAAAPERKGSNMEISLDFFPDMARGEMAVWLKRRAERLTGITGADFLSGLLNKRVGQMLVKSILGLRPTDLVGTVDDRSAILLSTAIKETRLRVTGVQGWREAQVTAGGAETIGFDPETMESRLVPRLFACGEVLDIDGDCGGYNLQWAWSSGAVAGVCAAAAAGRD